MLPVVVRYAPSGVCAMIGLVKSAAQMWTKPQACSKLAMAWHTANVAPVRARCNVKAPQQTVFLSTFQPNRDPCTG